MFIRTKITTACFLTSVMGAVTFLPAAFAASSTFYNVTAVANNDSLNIRSAAGANNDVVGTIPFNGKNITLIGETVNVGSTVWLNIKWKDKEGWVSKHYLKQGNNEIKNSESAIDAVQLTPDLAKQEVAKQEVTKQEVTKQEVTKQEVAKQEVEKKAAMETKKPIVEKTEELVVEEAKTSKQASAKDSVKIKEKPVKEVVVKKNKIKAEKGEWVLQCGDKKPYWKVEIHPKWLKIQKGDYETGIPITMKKQNKNRWNTALKTIVKGHQGGNKLEMTIKYAYSKRCYDTLSSLVVPYKVTTVFNGEELIGCCRAVQLKDSLDEQQVSQAD